jgi:hypothetical protein
MAEHVEPDPEVQINPERIREAFTSRELGQWELTVGVSLSEFGTSHTSAMLAWWAAHQDGDTRTPDDFLDLPISELTGYQARAVELLGKAPAGEPTPSGTSSEPDTASLPPSDTSTGSPSTSLQTSPA